MYLKPISFQVEGDPYIVLVLQFFFFQCTYEFILLARSVKSGNVYSSGKDPGYETIPADKISNPVGQEKQIFKSNRSSATSGLVIHIIDSLTISAVLLKLK